jgi:hypothetical protein
MTPAAAECARVALGQLHITMEAFLGEDVFVGEDAFDISPEEDPCWKAISN